MNNSDNDNPKIISIGQIDIDSSKFNADPDYNNLPILATQNLVLFPDVTIPISLVRTNSLHLAKKAYETGTPVGIVCQLNPNDERPDVMHLHKYGVIADIIKIFDLPDGSHTAIVKSRNRIIVEGESPTHDGRSYDLVAKTIECNEVMPRKNDKDFIAIVKAIKETALKLLKNIDGMQEFFMNVQNFPVSPMLVNMICTQSPFDVEHKMGLLSQDNVKDRATTLLAELTRQEQMLKVAEEIQSQARQSFDQQQRNAFLHQQMETIRQELYGESDDDRSALEARAAKTPFPKHVEKVFEKELDKLSRLNPQSPDYSVQFSYLEALLDLPWTFSPLNTDFDLASKILNDDHYALEKVKERILEQIAVLMNTPEGNAPILCLVGPPGVGKTSLGQSIAHALGRKYQRVSLGGLHDEAEIRGHRRTYIGAMPGRIMNAMKRAGEANPVLLLDEVDKIGRDFKGDPSAALLEVLDPEQNCRFHDNYIDLDYDLSKVLFIATANTLSTLSQPLLDRMEIIEISGYLLEEKVEIANRHIIPRILKEHNLRKSQLSFSPEAITAIIEKYTSESGVRQLEKRISQIARKIVLAKMSNQKHPHKIQPKHLHEYLGVEMFNKDRYEGNEFAGVVTGLAWTAVGGEILFIESSLSKAKGEKLTLTGNLGDVMKESAVIALQYVKSHSAELGIDDSLFEKYQLHIHVPEGAIPKDGPSAGITMATSIISVFTQRKIRERVAMTGEITLRGKVLPVGGIKEKILAAKRAGITDIILSNDNRKDINDIDEIYLRGLTFHYVDTVMEVVDIAVLPDKVDNAITL